jgi:predicted RNase H-like HicB family nuclease
MTECTILLTWDDEARVWVAESPNIQGLIIESDSLDGLIERVKTAVPDLMELNGQAHTVTVHGYFVFSVDTP